MFYTFQRITYLLCPTILLGKCARYDLTHFPKETQSGPWCHSLATCAPVRKEGELWGNRPAFLLISIFSPGADFWEGHLRSGLVPHLCSKDCSLSVKVSFHPFQELIFPFVWERTGHDEYFHLHFLKADKSFELVLLFHILIFF